VETPLPVSKMSGTKTLYFWEAEDFCSCSVGVIDFVNSLFFRLLLASLQEYDAFAGI